MKRQRQQTILDLVRAEPLSSQTAILERLHMRGFDVTQPTVSRDLDELGLARIRDADGYLRYSVPEDAAPVGGVGRLRRLLGEFALSMQASGSLVVIHTPPGAANAIALVLDQVGVEGVIGTVAGDDTILVIGREGTRGRTVLSRLQAIQEQEEAG
ncbi:MAG TPA: arginine repressor [Actinomycetota bacterium]